MTFPSRDGDLRGGHPTQLEGWLFRPSGPGPFPAIVALHGCAGPYAKGGSLMARDREWAERLRDLGFVVLLPDSFNPRGVSEICSRGERAIRAGWERSRDAYGALVYLQTLAFVRAERIGLLGWSNGAIAVLYTMAASSHARPKPLAHDFRAAVAFYPGCARIPDDWSPIAPLMILIGASDDWTPAAPCKELAQRIGSIDFVMYPDAYHDFDAPNQPLWTKRNIATTASGTATLGTNPAARTDAQRRVPLFFLRVLGNDKENDRNTDN